MSASATTSASNKRKSSVSENEKKDQAPKRQAIEASPVPVSTTAAAAHPPLVALPPPLMQYPNGQFVSVVHHPHQQPYYHMYHPQQPIYYPISPQQHPFLSPTMPPTPETSSVAAGKKTSTPRILPKSPESPGMYPQQQQQSPMSPFYHPYSIQMSPTLMPSTYVSSRQNSISSSPGLGPSHAGAISTTSATATTADQREKARKVSHSAIERRRRERINDKILQLKQLIPSCVEQDNLHKMSILQSAIDYISYLKEIVKKLDEKSGGDELLKGDHLKVKMQKSMLPKEVEPFTNQFSVHRNNPTTSTSTKTQEIDKEPRRSDLVVVEHQKGLKPMDIIKSGTPIISTGTTPLTPPQEPQQESTNHASFEPSISGRSIALSSSSSSDESKHMSLQNILC
ncbi:hypothetical protein MAM1_0190c07621 [Mucor ambiguus]|uniref:BHLH domain-containing protein n=1 Tax=Mucor ambiguus TaxID=91626 RepID=A0A0C9MKP6_9FUNG|nr:hypothetical protein MAM1_0190c07621 [Mucor ambiguus]